MGRLLSDGSLVCLLILLLSRVADAGVQRNAPRSIVLPLLPVAGRTVPGGGRRVLLPRQRQNATLPLHGAVKDLGYFYASLYLGTPPKRFTVIVDTGSTMTYVPCAMCGNGCGPNHQDAAFDPHLSSSATMIGCDSQKCHCGTPACTCSPAQQCSYTRSYAEHSSSSGILVEDVLTLHDGMGGVPVVFGCETFESGEIYKQQADGLFGLGNSDSSLVKQLAMAGVIEDTFSLCFGVVQGDGALLLGDSPALEEVSLQFTPLLSHAKHPYYYNVQLDAILMNSQALPVPADVFANTGYGTVLDSGTTFTYLPTSVFTSFVASVEAYALQHGLVRVPGPDALYNDICFGNAPGQADPEALASVFPELRLSFGGGLNLRLNPLSYLFVHTLNTGKYCLGVFDNGNAGTLLGGITFRNVLVNYDRRNKRIGFGHASCRELGLRYRPSCRAFAEVGNEVSRSAAMAAAAAGDCNPDGEVYDYNATGVLNVPNVLNESSSNGSNDGIAATSPEVANKDERQPSLQAMVLLSFALVLIIIAIVVGLLKTLRPLKFWRRYEPLQSTQYRVDADIELSKDPF